MLRAEWSIGQDVIEKDYVIGWLLSGIARNPELAHTWVFKGGTCLRECYYETYRFSKDLDFTIIEGGPEEPADLVPIFEDVATWARESSGIELVADELLVAPAVLRPIGPPYSDVLPQARVRSYSIAELFGEKLRALDERCRPRDLYDVVHLHRHPDLIGRADPVRRALERKCEFAGIEVPSADTIRSVPFRTEIEGEWENILGHQMPRPLVPFSAFRSALDGVFG